MHMKFIKEAVCKDVWLVTEPWFAEHANLHVVRGSQKTLLIDAGIGLEYLPQWLDEQEMQPDVVAITHSHFDHCGGLHNFSPKQIFLTVAQMDAIQNPALWGLTYLHAEDVPHAKQQRIHHYEPVAPTAANVLPQRIELGNYQLQVIQVGGHTNDSVMFYEEHQGWLFTGDLFYRGELYTDFANTSIEAWRQATAVIKNLDPLIVFPGHNEILQRDAARQLITHVEKQLG
jgi:glyoxylase-like metal-dependent hydrolase (beta-lactamase superfamily II)